MGKRFKYLSKNEERILFDKGIKKTIDFKGREVIKNLHEDYWTEWNNYQYDKGVFESHKEFRNGKLRYRLTAMGQTLRFVKLVKKLIKKYITIRTREIQARTTKIGSV